MILRPTIATVLNERYTKADGTCGLSLRVTYNRKKKFFRLPVVLTAEEYQRATREKPRGRYKEIALEIGVYESKAKSIIDSMPNFSWEKFGMLFYSDRMAQTNVYQAFEEYINKLKIEKRYGTASSYQCALNSLRLFKKELLFIDIDRHFLERYEDWMIQSGNSLTTVGFYLRALRSIVNSAIHNGFISFDSYPFGRGQYIIPSSNNPKRALSTDELRKIINHKFSDKSLVSRSRDFWVFMLLANGINLKDMLLLRYGNIKNGFIEFERAKTKRTRRVSKKIKIIITNEISEIISRWGNENQGSSTYLFPIVNGKMAIERQRAVIQQTTRLVNKHMKKLGQDLGIELHISTQSARHSYATTMMRNDMNIQFISDSLGHSSSKTTQNYLAGFEDETYAKAANILSELTSHYEK